VRRKTGYGIALMARLSRWTTKADHPFSLQGIRHGSCETADRFLRVRSSPAQRKDLQGLPIEKRKAKLEALLKKPPSVIRYSGFR
jgi:hypothetical protein